MTTRLITGAELHDGDTYLDPITGPHTVAHFDPFPGRFIGDTPDEHARVARCTDGTNEVVRDHGRYRRLDAAGSVPAAPTPEPSGCGNGAAGRATP